MTTQEAPTKIPPEAIERLQRAQAERNQAETKRICTEGEKVTDRFRGEWLRIVPVELYEKLKARAAERRLPEDASPQEQRRRWEEQRAYATELGVDLAALDRMRAAFSTEVAKITGRSDIQKCELTRLPDKVDAASVPLGAKREYNGWWDPGWSWYSSRPQDFAVWNADSYFDPVTNRSGNYIKFRQRETGDNTVASMLWHNGYMVFYTPPKQAGMTIEVDITCQISRFFVDTDNEPGVSHCDVEVAQDLYVEVYNSWADTDPMQITSGGLTWWNTTDPEDWAPEGDQFPQWSTWRAKVNTWQVCPPGKPLAFYFAIRNRAHGFKLDDTRLTAGVNAAWYFDDVRIYPSS
jgi:hypothetical protein